MMIDKETRKVLSTRPFEGADSCCSSNMLLVSVQGFSFAKKNESWWV